MSSTLKSTKHGKSGRSKNSIDNSVKYLRTLNPIEYQLSKDLFVKLGWTVMPTKRVMRKIVQYETQMAKPHLDWFEIYRSFGKKYYDEDETQLLFDFYPDDSCGIFYPNGRLAIEIRRSRKRWSNCSDIITLYTVFTPGGRDIIGVSRKSQITAIFDSIGNGMVMNENGEIRLSYNQLGGICVDNPPGVPYIWFWSKNLMKSEIKIIYNEASADHLVNKFFTNVNKSIKSSTGKNTPRTVKSSNKKARSVKEIVNNTKDSNQEEEKVEEKFEETKIHDRRNINLQFFAVGKNIRIELGTKLNLKKTLTSYNVDSSNLKEELLKCRFLDQLENMITDTKKIQDLKFAQRRAKRIGNSRNFMILKYKPFLKDMKKIHFS